MILADSTNTTKFENSELKSLFQLREGPPKLTQYMQFVKSGQKIWAGPSPPHLDKIQKNSSSRFRSLFYICLVQISIGSSWLLVNARLTRMCNQRSMEDQDWDKVRSNNGRQGKTRQGLIMAFRSDWREIMQPVWRFT